MDVNELKSRYETLQDDYNEMLDAYKMCMAKYFDLKKKLNESYGMYAILKKHYNNMQDRYYEQYEDLQDKYNELQSSFEESQDELASANAAIMKYEEAHNHLFSQLKRQISIVSELKEELRQTRIRLDEVEEARDNWKTEAIRRQNELNDIEMRNLMREKPAQECCEHCNKIDCSGCTICPF